MMQSCASHAGVRFAGQDELQIREQVESFVAAVNAADRDAFLAFFAEDASAFIPTNASRKVGIEQIRQAIESTFAQGPRNPPVRANDLVVSMDGDLAVATFDAGSGAQHARRTLVMRRIDGQWKIIHLHASNLVESP
jgi:uncharacterized protein (TIGR02246 family)